MMRKLELYGIGKVGPKGQVVIPAEARKKIGLNPGDVVILAGMPRHKVVMMVERSEFERHIGFVQRRHGLVDDVLKELKKLDDKDD